ncbi:nuclear mitotic apparatus protein 1 [Protopterus annectens]|uniref:nuclear mitotic apparatus protein 1 n=1 Tax=Protopterus annectens TaxID=7888 RepID=UPI001CFBF519|nr:nuclear mitotic apparatus protein 1 [Protopterus annectens]
MSSEGLDPSKTAALVTWVNSFKVADPVEKLTQLQDGVVLVKIFNKITSNDNEGQQVLEKPPEDRLRYLCSSLEVQCRYNPASGSLISWQNILRQENLERELAKVTVLLFYCSTLKNHSVDCEALDYNTQVRFGSPSFILDALYKVNSLTCNHAKPDAHKTIMNRLMCIFALSLEIRPAHVTQVKTGSNNGNCSQAVKLSQSSSSFEEYSPVSKPKTEVVRFLDLQKVASTSSMNKYVCYLQISAMQQRISRLVSLNEKQSEEGEPKELGELREKNESLMSRLQDALKLCQDLKTDNRQKDRKIDQLTQESGDLSWKVRGFATQVNQSEKTLKELSEEYEAAVDLWNKQRQELEDDLNATLDERKAAEEEVLILQGKIAVLEDQLKNAQEGGSKGEVMGDVLQLDSLKQQVMDLSVKVSNLEEKIKLLEEEKSLCETKLKSETDQFEEDRRQLNSIIENLQQSLSEFKIHKDTLEQMARDQEERLTAQIDTLNVEISKLNASIVEKDEEMLNLQKQVEEEKKQKGLLAEDLSKQEQSTRESIQVLKVQVDDLANKLKEKENSIMQLTKEWETEKASSASQISTMQEACKKSAQEKEAIAHCYEEFKKEKESELKAILQQLTDLKEAGGGNQAVSALQDEKNELLQKVQILDNSVLDLTTKCQNLQAESESHNKIHLEAVELLKTQLKEAENKVKDYEQTLAQRSELAKENMALKQKQDHLAQLLKQTESEIKNETKQVVFFREAHEKAIQEKESAVLQCEELKRSKENELNALSRRMHDLEEKCKKSESIVGVLQDEKKVLSCKVNEQDAAVHNLTTKYKNLETEHKTLVKSHEESLALVKANLQEANKKLKEYEQTIALHAELVKENQGLKQKEETLAQLLKQREAEREDEIKKSAALQEAHKKASLEKEASIKQFEKFKKDKEMEMKKLTEQIQAFEKAQSSNKTAVTDLQKEKNDLQLKIQELETAGHKMKSDYQALQAKMDNELKTHVKEIDLLKKNLQEAEKKVKKYEESISSHADLIKENDSLKQKEERLSKLLKQKETEKEDEVKRASLLQEACSKATQEKETAVAQYSALQREKEKEVKGLYDKIRSLQDAKGNNQAVVTSLQEETKELQQKIQELETTIQGVNSKYQSLQNENNAQTKAHMCTVDSLKASLQEMENRVTEYEQKLSSYSDLVKENDALKQKKDELTKLMKQKDAENEDKLKQISHLQEACEKATKEKVCSVKQSEEFKQTKENELQALSKQIKMMKAEQDTNSSAFTTMQKEKNELLQKLKELDNTVLELNSKYQSLQTENESQNKSHLKAVEMVKLKLQEEESKNKAILEENVRFKEQLTSMEADIGKLRESMETEKKKFSEDRVTDTKKISQMEDELKKAGKLKDQALKELEEERGKRSALEISVKNAEKDFSTKIEKMQESSSSASSKLKEKEAELKNLKAEVSSLRKQCDASRLSETQSNTDLQDQLAKLRESYQQANDQLQAEKGKAVELETRLKALTDEHQKQITTLQTELANTITMLKESESEKQRVVSELGCLQKNLGTASQKETQKASVVEGDAKKSEKQLESLSKELSVERAAKVELETKLRQAVESQEHLASIQSELCNATATLKAKEVEVEKLNSEIKSLQARLEETHGKQKEEVESRRSSLKSDHEKQLAASQKEAQEAKRKLETLTNKYEDAKQKTLDDRQKFQEEKQKLLSQVEKLEKSLTAETKKGEKLEKSMAAEAKKVEELNKKLGQQETTSKTHQQKVKVLRHNLSRGEQHALKELQGNTEITIIPADKGGAIVVTDSSYYWTEGNRHLTNPQHYMNMPIDPTPNFKKAIDEFLEKVVDEVIPQTIGMEWFEEVLTEMKFLTPIQYRIVLECMELVLKYNFVYFEGDYYHQKEGVAMGSACAPVYANIIMFHWEKQYVFKSVYNKYIVKYFRFLDDIFVLWNGNKENIMEFLEYINQTTSFLRFVHQVEKDEIHFLDIKLSKDKVRKCYISNVFRKEHFSNAYLHFCSDHPYQLKKNVVKGQMIRMARMISEEDDFLKEMENVEAMFIERGYPRVLITPIKQYVIQERQSRYKPLLHKINNTTDDNGLNNNNNTKINNKELCDGIDNNFSPYLTITYYKDIGWLKKSIYEVWNMFKNMAVKTDVFKSELKLSFRRNKNIKNTLEKKKIEKEGTSKKHGTFKCGRCAQCPYIAETKELRIPNLSLTLRAVVLLKNNFGYIMDLKKLLLDLSSDKDDIAAFGIGDDTTVSGNMISLKPEQKCEQQFAALNKNMKALRSCVWHHKLLKAYLTSRPVKLRISEHLKTQMEKVKSHYDAKKEQLDSVQEELNALKKDSTALKSDRDKLDKQLQHMILQAKEVEATNKNLSAKVRTLEVQLEHAERQLHELGKPEIATDALKSRATRRGSRAAEGRADISTDSLELSDIDEPQLNSTRKKNQGISKSMESITSQQLPSKVESLESLYFTPTPSRVHSRLDDSISSSMGDLSVDSSRTTRSTRSRTTQVINITMTKKEPVDTEPDSANSSFLSTQSGHVPKNVKGTRLRSAASASSIASCTSQESLSETQRSISEDHSALLSLPGYHPPTRSSARLSHTGRTSTSSTTSNRKSLSVGTCQDEPDQLDEWNRLAELQRRNKICPPHLKTSYPLESKPPLGIATVTDEEVKTGDPNETLRRASLLPSQVKETSAASQSITTRRQRKRQSEESHHGPDTPESKRSASCFPRPLTPKDKKEGRKLTFDVNLRSDSQSATQPERRQSMAFSILNTPQSIRKSLLSRGKKKETPKQSPRATSSPRVISTKSPHSASIRSPRGTSRTTNTSSASIKKSPRLSASLRKVKEHRLLRRKT